MFNTLPLNYFQQAVCDINPKIEMGMILHQNAHEKEMNEIVRIVQNFYQDIKPFSK